jgi:hypothetical protein
MEEVIYIDYLNGLLSSNTRACRVKSSALPYLLYDLLRSPEGLTGVSGAE